MNDYIHDFLKKMANLGPGEVWTERHWQQANGILANYEVEKGYRKDFWEEELESAAREHADLEREAEASLRESIKHIMPGSDPEIEVKVQQSEDEPTLFRFNINVPPRKPQ